ncbi:MAG: protein kinase [Archangium sp.]|nr:protein kinase [Archangium sp.]
MPEEDVLPQLPGFQVLRRVGHGGMGVVLEAERVGPGGFRKRVALKRLALDLSIDKAAVERFLLEARICARLDHDNIVQVQDLWMEADRPYMVMELVRGATLWDLSRHLSRQGPVPWWVPLAVADQALSGLAYAHAFKSDEGRPLGLVHRDLTPRNLMVTESGGVKVLDFGIAKLTASFTSPPLTAQGTVQGTLEFFSPEQAYGAEVDLRSDLFQVGGAIYWALSGRTPHGAGSPGEVLARAMTVLPPPLKTLRADVPPAVSDFLERVMAREPGDRFADAAAMQLEVRALLATAGSPGAAELAALIARLDLPPPPPSAPLPEAAPAAEEVLEPTPNPQQPTVLARPLPARPAGLSRRALVSAVAATAAVAGAGGFLAGRRSVGWTPRPPRPAPEYGRLTFGRGTIYSARFAGEDSFVYSASFGGGAVQTWLGVRGNPEGRRLDLGTAELAAISRQQELALLTDVEQVHGFVRRGTLAQAQLSGGAPRKVLEGVQWVDFHPQSSAPALVRWKDEQTTLEYPRDTVRYQTPTGWIGEIRFSPNGRHLAFVRHPARSDDRGSVFVVDLRGTAPARELSSAFSSLRGLGWRDSETVWFSASREGLTGELHEVDLAGQQRLLERTPVSLRLLDLGSGGRALLTRDSAAIEAAGRLAGEPIDRDLSLFDASFAAHLSADGTHLLLGEGAGDAVGPEGAVLLQAAGGRPVRLGTGIARELSPDGQWALVNPVHRKSARLLPTGAGLPREFSLGALLLQSAVFFPDGQHLLVFASSGDDAQMKFVRVSIETGEVTPLPLDGFLAPSTLPFTPDGKKLALINAASQRLELVSLETGAGEPVKGAFSGETALEVAGDGKSIYVGRLETHPLEVFKVDLATGLRASFRKLGPADAAGVDKVFWAVLTPDGQSWAFTYHRMLSTLFLATGLDPGKERGGT